MDPLIVVLVYGWMKWSASATSRQSRNVSTIRGAIIIVVIERTYPSPAIRSTTVSLNSMSLGAVNINRNT